MPFPRTFQAWDSKQQNSRTFQEPSHKIWSKSVHNFFVIVVTDRHTQTNVGENYYLAFAGIIMEMEKWKILKIYTGKLKSHCIRQDHCKNNF